MSSSELAASSGVVTDRTDEFLERPEEKRPDATTEPDFVGGGIVVLGLLGAAGTLAYAGLVDSPMFSPLPAPVLLGGALVMVAAVVAVARKMKWRPSDLPAQAPWTLRPGWQSPELEEDLYLRASSPWTAALFAVPAVGIGGWAFYQMYWIYGKTAGLIFLLIPAAALIPGASALRRAWHRWTYGTSTLRTDEVPARLGQTFSAEVKAGLDPDAVGRRGPFEVSLTCYHRTQKDRVGGESTRVSWNVVWKAEAQAEGHRALGAGAGLSAQSGSGEEKVKIPVSFDLPEKAPPSTPEKKSTRIAWVLEVSTEAGGWPGFESRFEIPVFEAEQGERPVHEAPQPDLNHNPT